MKKLLSILLPLIGIIAIVVCYILLDKVEEPPTESTPTESTPAESEDGANTDTGTGDSTNGTDPEPEQKPAEKLASSYAGVWKCGLDKEYKITIDKIDYKGKTVDFSIALGVVNDDYSHFLGTYEDGVISFSSDYRQRSGVIKVEADKLILKLDEWEKDTALVGKELVFDSRPELYSGMLIGELINSDYINFSHGYDYVVRIVYFSEDVIEFRIENWNNVSGSNYFATLVDGQWCLSNGYGTVEFVGNGILLNLESGVTYLDMKRGAYYFEMDPATGLQNPDLNPATYGNLWTNLSCILELKESDGTVEGKVNTYDPEKARELTFSVSQGDEDHIFIMADASGNEIGRYEKRLFKHHSSSNYREPCIYLELYSYENGARQVESFILFDGVGAKG